MGDALSRVRVWKGDKEKVALGLTEDLYVTIPRRQYDRLKASMSVDPQLTAPIDKGRRLGKVTIALSGQTVAEMPLVALQQINEGGIINQIKDSVLLWFE